MHLKEATGRVHGLATALVSGTRRTAGRLNIPGRLGTLLAGALLTQVATSAPAEWTHLGGNAQSNQYSELDQIDSKSVASLGLLWYSDLPIGEGLVGNPLVMDGVVYQGGPYGSAVATDVRTGKTLWSFVPMLGLERYSLRSAHQASTNRGLGIDETGVYIAGGS
jgi:quinohemoprotein ethanol dehydrogenase